jgi:hypothetical protein
MQFSRKLKSYAVVTTLFAASTLLLALYGCGGSDSSTGPGPRLQSITRLPNIDATAAFSYDIATIDPDTNTYYLADRNNRSIDVIDMATGTLKAQFKASEPDVGGFAGCRKVINGVTIQLGVDCVGANSELGGPNGVNIGGNNLFVGDVNRVIILNKNTGATVSTIKVNVAGSAVLSGNRADEGCYDAEHTIYAISSPNETTPTMTFIDVSNPSTPKAITTLSFPGGAGLEACQYDSTTHKFFVNNDGSAANPRGEIDGISGTWINSLSRQVYGAALPYPDIPVTVSTANISIWPMGNCDPVGLAQGADNQLGAVCSQGGVSEQLTFQIWDKTSTAVDGSLLATINVGGADQIAYDSTSQRWVLPMRYWTANGMGGLAAGASYTPMVAIVNTTNLPAAPATIASTDSRVVMLPGGTNTHSVAVYNGKAAIGFAAPPNATNGLNPLLGGASFDSLGGVAMYLLQ